MEPQVSTAEPLCVRCSKHQKTCCQSREIYTTPGDRERIAAFTGRYDFFRFAPASPDHLDQDDDPAWGRYVFRPDGTRRVLQRQANGDCTFLGNAGCVLPLEVRPLVCRLYPYDYTEFGIRSELQHDCPVQLLEPQELVPEERGQVHRDRSLLVVLDMNREHAERWRSKLYRELRWEIGDADRPDLRPQE